MPSLKTFLDFLRRTPTSLLKSAWIMNWFWIRPTKSYANWIAAWRFHQDITPTSSKELQNYRKVLRKLQKMHPRPKIVSRKVLHRSRELEKRSICLLCYTVYVMYGGSSMFAKSRTRPCHLINANLDAQKVAKLVKRIRVRVKLKKLNFAWG